MPPGWRARMDRTARGSGRRRSAPGGGTHWSARRACQAQVERYGDLVPGLVGGLPVALAYTEVEPPQPGLAGQVADRDAAFGGLAESEGHLGVARHPADLEGAVRLVAVRGLHDPGGEEMRFGEFGHREQVIAPQRVVTVLVPGIERCDVHRDFETPARR